MENHLKSLNICIAFNFFFLKINSINIIHCINYCLKQLLKKINK